MITANHSDELLPHLFRQEYGKMTAVLCRHFGLKHIETAEDLVSEAFTKALEVWPVHGIPKQPEAWLYAVAKNKAKDYLKRNTLFASKVKEALQQDASHGEFQFNFDEQTISDSQLAMIFAICDPALSEEAQICLALQVLCGFSVEEIAHAFMCPYETIKKRLHRARKSIQGSSFQISNLTVQEISERLETVLRTLYLLFNEGYFSTSNNHLVRKELCLEALRLTLMLVNNPSTNTPSAHGLLALMCFQSSRLAARTDVNGDAILYEEQDVGLWDQALIEKGNFYLIEAFARQGISKYHLEAAIAYWHTTPKTENKWKHILQLYDQLLLLEHSPIMVLNRLFALAKVEGHSVAIDEMGKLNLSETSGYHSLLGYLYVPLNRNQAIFHYQKAIYFSSSRNERKSLQKELDKLLRTILPDNEEEEIEE